MTKFSVAYQFNLSLQKEKYYFFQYLLFASFKYFPNFEKSIFRFTGYLILQEFSKRNFGILTVSLVMTCYFSHQISQKHKSLYLQMLPLVHMKNHSLPFSFKYLPSPILIYKYFHPHNHFHHDHYHKNSQLFRCWRICRCNKK